MGVSQGSGPRFWLPGRALGVSGLAPASEELPAVGTGSGADPQQPEVSMAMASGGRCEPRGRKSQACPGGWDGPQAQGAKEPHRDACGPHFPSAEPSGQWGRAWVEGPNSEAPPGTSVSARRGWGLRPLWKAVSYKAERHPALLLLGIYPADLKTYVHPKPCA